MATQLAFAFPVEPVRPKSPVPVPRETMNPEPIPHFEPQAPFSIDALAQRLVRFHKHRGLEYFTEWKEDGAA